MAQVCPSLSCTSLQRRSLISSTDQMEQPRISTSLLSPGLSSSPGGGGAEGEDHNAQLEMFHVCFPVGEKFRSHHSSAPASARPNSAARRGAREPEGRGSLRTWWASPCWPGLPPLWPPWCPRNLPPGSELACRMRFSSPGKETGGAHISREGWKQLVEQRGCNLLPERACSTGKLLETLPQSLCPSDGTQVRIANVQLV